MTADQTRNAVPGLGVSPADLSDDEVFHELRQLYMTRLETLRHGSEESLATHSRRTAELEDEYLRRYPRREVDPSRLRVGARTRT